jgi:hypothetical protein
MEGLMHRAVRDGDVAGVKKCVAEGLKPTRSNYERAVEKGHRNVVEYFHSLGMPDLRSEQLSYYVEYGWSSLTKGALAAGASPTERDLEIATAEVRVLLEEALSKEGKPIPDPEEFRVNVAYVFTRSNPPKVFVDCPPQAPSYVPHDLEYFLRLSRYPAELSELVLRSRTVVRT